MRTGRYLGAASFVALAACAGTGPSDALSVDPPAPKATEAALARPHVSETPRRARPSDRDDPTADALTVEQDGRVVPIEDHVARLHRRGFAIIVRIRGGARGALLGTEIGVRLNASFESRLFDLAVAGAPQPAGEGAAFGDGSAMAERIEPEPTLFLAASGCHYWYWNSEEDSRCNSITREGDDILCRRAVDNLWDVENGSGPESIVSRSEPALYLVSRQVPTETAHGYVKLVFEPLKPQRD